MLDNFLILILGAILPILLWPIEYILPFPHVIEEVAKFLGLWWLAKKKLSLKSTILFALAFTLSESVLYMMNLFALGQIYLFPKRLFLTGLLHTTTALILFASFKKRTIWKLLAITIAIFFHYAYNNLIGIIFVSS